MHKCKRGTSPALPHRVVTTAHCWRELELGWGKEREREGGRRERERERERDRQACDWMSHDTQWWFSRQSNHS